ncbi:MAG: tetratricopeptide repeat protein [Rubrivivax sp.]
MGTAHYLGRGRPARMPPPRRTWYREAANGGDIGAQYLLAAMYERGDGVAQDLRLALHWYRQAARGGDEAAPGKVRELERRMGPPSWAAAAASGAYRTTFTIGCELSARYSASSCSRLVAVTVSVRPT